MAVIRPPGGGGTAIAASGWIAIADIDVPGGAVANKVFQNPGDDTILQSCTVSGTGLDVIVRSSYPKVTVNGTPATLPPAGDSGHYEGDVSITIAGTGPVVANCITANDEVGAEDEAAVTLEAPPVITALSFTGGYPGAQTELKEDDQFDIQLTADKNFDQVEVLDYEAGKSKVIPVASTTSTTVTIDIADRGNTAVLRPARVRVRDASTGAYSASRDTDELGGSVDGTDLVNCNNLHPTVSISTISYPATQEALKGAESATVSNTVSDFTSVSYVDPTGTQLNIANPSTYESSKSVTRTGGSYNVSTPNFRIIANRAANDATSSAEDVVQIADADQVITVSPATARVRSGVSPGADTTITISSDQQLLNAPSMDPAAGRGTFQGSWSGGPSVWTRDLRVPDSENPADGSSHTWLNLVTTNLAGKVVSTITTGGTYVIGGFTQRTINYPAFTANSTETFPLTDEAKLSAGAFSNGNSAVVQPFGTPDTSDVGKEGWCAPTAASGVAVNMRMLHIPSVNANTAGLTLTLVEETV